MNYFIDVAVSAQRDLADAFDYIDLNLKNPSAADKLVAIAWKKFRSLDTFPQRFSLVNDSFLSSLGIRLIPVQNYLAFYKVDSLEQMYGDLCLDLELHSKSGFLKYKKDKSDVLMNFI